MELEAAYLLQQIREDMKMTSERMHRDSRRQHALRAASLALGTGKRADEIRDNLTRAGLHLRPARPRLVSVPR